jgi:hypothetical protein
VKQEENSGTPSIGLLLGAQVAEIVEALYARVLRAPAPAGERQLLTGLAKAAARLAELAEAGTKGFVAETGGRPSRSATRTSSRRGRRIARAERITDRIIAWAERSTA